MKTPWFPTLATLSAACLSACASAPHSSDKTKEAVAELRGSSVEITYVLGHAERALLLKADGEKVQGETSVDHKPLKSGTVDPNRYRDFLQKVSEYMNRRTVASTEDSEPCRTPFVIVLRDIGAKDSRKLRGCRHHEEGHFGRLVRDGEFLLFSHN